MSSPNPTQTEVQRELACEIDWRRTDIESLIGQIEVLAGYIRDDFGQGSERVAKRLDDCVKSLVEAHGDIGAAYNEATGGS